MALGRVCAIYGRGEARLAQRAAVVIQCHYRHHLASRVRSSQVSALPSRAERKRQQRQQRRQRQSQQRRVQAWSRMCAAATIQWRWRVHQADRCLAMFPDVMQESDLAEGPYRIYEALGAAVSILWYQGRRPAPRASDPLLSVGVVPSLVQSRIPVGGGAQRSLTVSDVDAVLAHGLAEAERAMAHDELIARRLRAADVAQEDAVLAGRLQTEERREAARERREGDAQHIRRWLDGPVDLSHFRRQCGRVTPKHLIVTLA